MPLLLLSKSNPLRRASIGFGYNHDSGGIYSGAMLQDALADPGMRPVNFLLCENKSLVVPR